MHEMTYSTLGQLVRERAETVPGRTPFQCEDGSVTYGELWTRGTQLAQAFLGRGLGRGDTVAMLTSVGVPTLEIWVGLAVAGVTEVPLNPALRGESLAYQVRQSNCRALVVDQDLLHRVPDVGTMPSLEFLVLVGGAHDAVGETGTVEYESFIREGAPTPPEVEVLPSDIAVICFTSGTTGPPKGVELSHSANFKVALDVCAEMEYGPDDVLLSMFPFSHINARYTSGLAAIISNARVVFRRGFSASTFWETCHKEGITAFNYLGGLPTFLLNQPSSPLETGHQVRRAYGAGSTAETVISFESRFGVPLVEVLGSTEMGTICENTLKDRKPGSCGRPVKELEVALHDQRGFPVEPGVPGEVVIRPRFPDIVMNAYHRNPEATAHAFRGLWFHTGDRCRVDQDGWYYFFDRVKDSIRRRGENISSWEVEQVALSHPHVTEAAAIGLQIDDVEEEVLLIVAIDLEHLSPEDLLDHCQASLPYFAVPRFVRFVDALPRNATSKVRKDELRKQGLTEDTWDSVATNYKVAR
jgi:carnitine-CoA ligase